jgi:hypothetical protein
MTIPTGICSNNLLKLLEEFLLSNVAALGNLSLGAWCGWVDSCLMILCVAYWVKTKLLHRSRLLSLLDPSLLVTKKLVMWRTLGTVAKAI